jgi:HflC protein
VTRRRSSHGVEDADHERTQHDPFPAGALVLLVASNSLYVIKETERGVLLRFGEVVNPDLKPGLHLKIPFVNNVRKFDGRVVTLDSQPERFFTQEQKALIIDSYAKYRIADTATFYKATNGEESRVAGLLSQRINDGLRNQVAIRTIQEVVSGERDQLMEVITRQLDEVAQVELGVRDGRCARQADRPAAGGVGVRIPAHERGPREGGARAALPGPGAR